MADQNWATALAVETQADFDTIGPNVPGLGSPLAVADGIVLGDRASGDGESGITIATVQRIARQIPQVADSFTEQADSFQRVDITGFSIAFPMQGNGATSTPAAGEAKPFAGIDAIFQGAGLVGANGTNPLYEYTPLAGTTYLTIGLWVADLFYVFKSCVVESLDIVLTPGENAIITANFLVGSHDPATQLTDGVTFPTLDYGTMATLAAPTVDGLAFSAFGQARGFESMTITIANAIAKFKDSNVALTGERQAQTGRVITANGTIYVAAADSKAAYDNVTGTTAPTADLTFQLGTIAGAAGVLNAFKVECNNLQAESIKHNEIGDVLAVEISNAKCTATAAGSEFKLTAN